VTLGTAGRESSFIISGRDIFGNSLQTCESLHVLSITSSTANALIDKMSSEKSQFSVAKACTAKYLLTISGTYRYEGD
jgi:hypothetical protein